MVIFKEEWDKLYYTQHTFLNNMRQFVGCLTVWFQSTCIVKAHSWACSKSLQNKFFPFIEKCSKVNCHFLGQWLTRVRHAETDRAEKKESKGHSALLWAKAKQRAKAQRAIWPYCVWVPERAKHRKERASAGCAVRRNREKHNESVREWKRKMRLFSLLKLHTRKINWWSSHGVFGCYNHRELEYSEEDFTTGFVMRLYLLIEIYLLYI